MAAPPCMTKASNGWPPALTGLSSRLRFCWLHVPTFLGQPSPEPLEIPTLLVVTSLSQFFLNYETPF